MGRDDDGELVWSSEMGGRVKPAKGGGKKKRRGKGPPPLPTATGKGVRVARATQGRKGKGVTVVTGLPLDDVALRDLAKQLKARVGAGGKVRDGAIEIQGEHRDTVVEALKALGYDAKKSGG
jgi:translation initiation factor 1